MPTVAYASFCHPKDKERGLSNAIKHMESHKHPFDEKFFVFQRCNGDEQAPEGFTPIHIPKANYAAIFNRFGIKYPDPVMDELTHGETASHWWANHCVNHLSVLLYAKSDYIVFADGDCFISQTQEGRSWIEEGLSISLDGPFPNNFDQLEKSKNFCISPSDGRPHAGPDRIMSQQMFLVNRKRMLEVIWEPWDGKFIEGGPMQEYFGMLEGRVDRHMRRHNLYRYVLPQTWKWEHLQWH